MHPRDESEPAPAGRPTPGPDGAGRITRGLVEAGVALSSAHSLDHVLQVLADVARDLVQARYAALGVIDEAGQALSAFITSGLTAEQRVRMGELPTGHGILGVLIRDARPLRLADLREHPASVGVPDHHPPMRSFLGVPVVAKGRVFGNLYVTDKLGAEEFGEEDVAIVEMLAAQAAVAIENAQLRAERDRFFAAASHELGNAVAAVRIWSRQLLRRPPDTQEEWLEGVGRIAASAEDARQLIDDLLSLGRIREGRLALAAEPVDVAALVRESVALVVPDAEAAGLTLEVLALPERIPVLADSGRVRQILLNLLGNAVKFTPAGRGIVVGMEPEDGAAVVWIRDQGPGIAAADQERIFLPYEQVPGVARGRGAGLGLPLSRQLARLMGGELWVASEVGRGSTFHLRLPRPAAAAGSGV